MTAVFPDGVSTLGNETVWWVPSIANPATGVRLAELTAGVKIQTAIRGFNPQGTQNSSQDVRLSTKELLENPGRNQVTIDPIEIVYDPQDPDNATKYKAYTSLVPGSSGFIVDRRGLDSEAAAAATQVVDIYTAKLGARNRVSVDPTQDGGKFTSTIKPFVSGPVYQDVAILA